MVGWFSFVFTPLNPPSTAQVTSRPCLKVARHDTFERRGDDLHMHTKVLFGFCCFWRITDSFSLRTLGISYSWMFVPSTTSYACLSSCIQMYVYYIHEILYRHKYKYKYKYISIVYLFFSPKAAWNPMPRRWVQPAIWHFVNLCWDGPKPLVRPDERREVMGVAFCQAESSSKWPEVADRWKISA